MSSTRFDEDIWLLERISQGVSFELFLAFWPEENDKVLIKKVREDLDPQRKEEAEQRLLKEAATLEEFWSPYFPKVYDIRRQGEEEEAPLYLIVQYFAGISLRNYLHLHIEKKTITSHFIQNFIWEMDHALQYLHNKKGIVHLDISPDNIIITQDNKVKLIDFEDSRKSGSYLDKSKLRGKEQYLSPELISALYDGEKEISFEPKWDLYAYGKTLEELCQQTKGAEKIKCLSFKKKIRNLKKVRSTKVREPKEFKNPLFVVHSLLDSLKWPEFNSKHLTAALVSFIILGLTLLGLELLGRSQMHKKRRNSHFPTQTLQSTKRVSNYTQPIKKALPSKRVKKVIQKEALPKKAIHTASKKKTKKKKSKKLANHKRTPQRVTTQRPTTQRANPQELYEAKAQLIKKNNHFKAKIAKLMANKEPHLQECMNYESQGSKGKLSLSFYLQAQKGRAKKISFENSPNLSQLTKSCLMALYADIVFPEPPTRQELKITQSFTFANDLNQDRENQEFAKSLIL